MMIIAKHSVDSMASVHETRELKRIRIVAYVLCSAPSVCDGCNMHTPNISCWFKSIAEIGFGAPEGRADQARSQMWGDGARARGTPVPVVEYSQIAD